MLESQEHSQSTLQKKDYYGACLDDDDLGGVASGDLLIPLDHSLPPSRNATLAKLYHSANHILSAESPDKVSYSELRILTFTRTAANDPGRYGRLVAAAVNLHVHPSSASNDLQ